MRKFIAVMLTLLQLFALTACTAEKTDSGASVPASSDQVSSAEAHGGYEIDFADTQPGYITHTSASAYSVTLSDGFESNGDFYIRLPQGTVLSCQKSFAFYCYDENFSLDTAVMEASGESLIYFSAVMSTGSFTLSEECFVRFAVQGSLNDIVITLPDGYSEAPLTGSKAALVYAPQIKTVGEELADKTDAVNYIFITDIHYGSSSTSDQGAALLNQVKAAVEIANANDAIDFVVIGGDTTTGMYDTKADALKYTKEALEPLKNCKKPVFVLMGNHDDNSYHYFTYKEYYPERIISDKDWNDNILSEFCPDDIKQNSKYQNSKYYYYDLSAKKTRVICLDALDYRAPYDQNGNISALPSSGSGYWSGTSWWGYSTSQMQWLTEEAMTAPDDWDYIFVSHMGIDSETNCYGYSTKNGSTLRNIIKAYQNGSVFNSDSLYADFTGKSGRILSYQFGHNHAELTYYSEDIDLWQICTSTASVAQNTTKPLEETSISDKTLGWNILTRALGGENEACFDIMSVSDTVIYKYAFGAGSDSVMKY